MLAKYVNLTILVQHCISFVLKLKSIDGKFRKVCYALCQYSSTEYLANDDPEADSR